MNISVEQTNKWQPPKLSLRETLLAMGLATAVLLYGYYAVVYHKQAAVLTELNAQILHKQTVLQSAQQELNAHPNQSAYQQELLTEQKLADGRLPSEDAMPTLLKLLSATAKEAGVSLVSIKPGIAVNKNTYYEIPLEITAKCKYSDLLAFIRRLEFFDRFNTITKLTVRPEQGILQVQLNTSVYVHGLLPQKTPTQQK